MKGYSRTSPEEKESYKEYLLRKEEDWEKRIKTICTEIKDSSLKPIDKANALTSLSRQITNVEIYR